MPKDRCLETRLMPHGVYRRTRIRPDGVRYTTLEVPEAAMSKFSKNLFIAAVQKAWRGVEQRALTAKRRAHIAAHPHAKSIVLAHELGISDGHVRAIRRELARKPLPRPSASTSKL